MYSRFLVRSVGLKRSHGLKRTYGHALMQVRTTDISRPPHLWQTARPPLSRNNCLRFTPVLKVLKALLKEVEVLKVLKTLMQVRTTVGYAVTSSRVFFFFFITKVYEP